MPGGSFLQESLAKKKRSCIEHAARGIFSRLADRIFNPQMITMDLSILLFQTPHLSNLRRHRLR
jgi:hypothetical protein